MATLLDQRANWTVPADGRIGQWGRRRSGRLRLLVSSRAGLAAPLLFLRAQHGPVERRLALVLPRRYDTSDRGAAPPVVVETAAAQLEAWCGPDPWVTPGASLGRLDLRLELAPEAAPVASTSAQVALGSRTAQPADGAFYALQPLHGPGPWADLGDAEQLHPAAAPRVYLEHEAPAAPVWGQVLIRWGRGHWYPGGVAPQIAYSLPGLAGPGRCPLLPPGASDYRAQQWGGAAGVLELAVDPGIGVALDLAAYQILNEGWTL